jgi:hypothetical protein
MDLFTALMNIDPSHLLIAAGAVLALFGMGAGGTPDEDDNSDYDNASWNPSSVNYNG